MLLPKNVNIKNKNDEVEDVLIDCKQRYYYYYYYTCIPFHELLNRLSMLLKCKKTNKHDTDLYE